MKIRRLNSKDPEFSSAFLQLTTFDDSVNVRIRDDVTRIIQDVKERGDEALLRYTRKFDLLNVNSADELFLEADILETAWKALAKEQKKSLREAATRIEAFHKRQIVSDWSFKESDGSKFGQTVNAIEKVGLYVPGGKAAYPSTVLMNSIPAKVAGVEYLVMVVPTPRGVRNDLVLAAAFISGVDRVLTIGGAQAISALAYGTKSIPRVDKIVGPGNAYVTEAKRQVFGQVGIDMIAGPSEILVVADEHANPDWVAMDLFSQAEHDEMAQALLLSWNKPFINAVENSMNKFLHSMPRSEIIKASFENRSALIQVENSDEASRIINQVAPEHLEIMVKDSESLVKKVVNAGAIFVGNYSSEALGDYCAGPNHVLPTSGSARFSSPLGVYDFQKRSSLIQVSKEGAIELGKIAHELALGEGLFAHAQSAIMRTKSI